MYQYMQFLTKKWRQQGAIIAFTALLLPMLIVGTGLAVDLGHVYVHYSRLQNAADAAALAGAHEYAVQGEKVNNHPKADKMAEQYVQGEYHNLDRSESIVEKKYQAKTKDNITYYRVKLTKEVPLYFLGGIYKKIEGKETFTVPVDSVAVVPAQASGGFFNNMFIFKEKFDAVNSLENPDKLSNNSYSTDSKNMITTTFDGRIVYTKGDGVNNPDYKYESLSYSTQTPKLDRFFTSAAKEKNANNNINTLMEGTDEDKAKFDGKGTLKSGYWSKAEYYNYNFQTFYDYMEKKTAQTENKATDQTVKTSSNLFDSDIIRVPKTNSIPNLTIEVDKNLGNNDNPVYIYVEAGMGVININLNTDTGRPLIICIAGSDTQRPQVHFNLNGHTFKGVVYAPYCNKGEGVLVNADNSTFMGTIVGTSISLRGNRSHYIYKDYIGGGSSSSGGSGGTAGTEGITLITPPEGINWD